MNETEKFYELDDIFFQEEARRFCASSFALYIHSIDNKKKLNRVLQLSTELMECIVFLSENGGLLMRTADYYDKQIKELEEKMEK